MPTSLIQLVLFICLCSHWLLFTWDPSYCPTWRDTSRATVLVTKTWCVLVHCNCPDASNPNSHSMWNPFWTFCSRGLAFDHAPFTRKITHWTKTSHLDVPYLCCCAHYFLRLEMSKVSRQLLLWPGQMWDLSSPIWPSSLRQFAACTT